MVVGNLLGGMRVPLKGIITTMYRSYKGSIGFLSREVTRVFIVFAGIWSRAGLGLWHGAASVLGLGFRESRAMSMAVV